MWDSPRLLNLVADLLLTAAALVLLLAAAYWLEPHFPVREVVVVSELREVQRKDVERALGGRLGASFFRVDLEGLRQSLEQQPFVRRAQVRRQWPSRLEIVIEEHRPAAWWGEDAAQLVNDRGEVFAAGYFGDENLPMLMGPSGTSAELLRRYAEFAQQLAPTGLRPQRVLLSERLAWQIWLDNGMLIDLGREQAKVPIRMRLARFVAHHAQVTTGKAPLAVDIRYPNGFVLRYDSSAESKGRGKQ